MRWGGGGVSLRHARKFNAIVALSVQVVAITQNASLEMTQICVENVYVVNRTLKEQMENQHHQSFSPETKWIVGWSIAAAVLMLHR